MNKKLSPWLSIITVCYNDSKNLKRTLQNIREQNCKFIQLIVVDGDSTDDTKSVITSYTDVITDWISEKDAGLFNAMNKGIKLANGEYIVFLNAGDVFHDPQVISYIYSHHHQEDILYGNAVFVHQDGRYKGPRHKKIPKTLDWRSFKSGMVICHQALIVKTSVARSYDIQYQICADLDWAICTTKRAKSTLNLGITICDFQRGGLSDKKRGLALLERWKILSKHFGWAQTMWSHMKIPSKFLLWKLNGYLNHNIPPPNPLPHH